MAKKVYKAESFKVRYAKTFAKELEEFINEYAAQGWIVEQFYHDVWSGLSGRCLVLFSKDEDQRGF